MRKDLNILIVDDHPMTVDGYINVLSDEDIDGYNLIFTKALDCKQAYDLINDPATKYKFDIAYLDLSLPPYPEKNINSGFDLGLLIKRTIPNCIIIILTMHSEATLIDRLVKEINPKGILCKSDIDIDEFVNAFKIIFKGSDTAYMSSKILKSLKDKAFDNFNLDSYDKQILMRLSEGIATKNIPHYVPLSLSAIEKRKAQMKAMFLDGKGGDDHDLIETIKRMGIL
jgi:DNA-binding NarL/FixJ family response regulator